MADASNSGGNRAASYIVIALVAALFGAAAGHFAPFAIGHGWHHRGPWGHFGGHHDMSASGMQEHVERMVQHITDEVSATAEQQSKISQIAKAAVADLQPLHQQLLDAHKKAIEIFRQPTLDRTALEALRAEQIARVDAVSKRMTQAIADMAEVLTPEQRAKLADRINSFGPRGD